MFDLTEVICHSFEHFGGTDVPGNMEKLVLKKPTVCFTRSGVPWASLTLHDHFVLATSTGGGVAFAEIAIWRDVLFARAVSPCVEVARRRDRVVH